MQKPEHEIEDLMNDDENEEYEPTEPPSGDEGDQAVPDSEMPGAVLMY